LCRGVRIPLSPLNNGTMEKLNELIRETEAAIAKVDEDVYRQKGMFDVSKLLDRIGMWNMRLEALKEAKALWMEDEWKKCSESKEYFMERHGRIQKPEPGSVNIEKAVTENRLSNDEDFKPRMGLMAAYVKRMVNAPKSHEMDSGREGDAEDLDDGE